MKFTLKAPPSIGQFESTNGNQYTVGTSGTISVPLLDLADAIAGGFLPTGPTTDPVSQAEGGTGSSTGIGLKPADTGAVFEQRIFNYPMALMNGGFTFQDIYGVPFYNEPCLVRAVYENDTTSSYTINTSAVSSGRAFEPNPLTSGSGSNAAWTIAASGLVVPAASGVAGVRSYAATPWTFLQMDARTDGSPFGALYLRTYVSAAGRCVVGNSSNDVTTWHGQNFHNDHESHVEGGDFASANQSTFVPAITNSQYVAGHIQVLSLKRSIVIAGAGDSTTQGLTTYGQHDSFVAQAAELLSTVAKPVGWANYGSAGQTTTTFFQQATSVLADIQRLPTILIIQPASVNDSNYFTTAAINASYSGALQLALLCKQNGVLPVFRTMPPSGLSSAQEIVRNALNATIRNSGFPYLDVDAVLSDNASPVATLLPQFNSGDNVHWTAAGHAAVAALLVTSVLPALNVH